MYLFPLAAFKVLFLSLVLSNLIVICLGVILFVIFLCLSSRICGFMKFSSNVGTFQPLFLQSSSTPRLPLSFGNFIYTHIRQFEVVSHFTDDLFLFPTISLFSLCSCEIVSIAMSSSSLFFFYFYNV